MSRTVAFVDIDYDCYPSVDLLRAAYPALSADCDTPIDPRKVKYELGCVIHARIKRQGHIYFFYSVVLNKYAWGTKEDAHDQMKIWRRGKMDGEVFLNEKYNLTKTICGKEWHILVVQYGTSPETIKPIGMDQLGLGFDDGMFLVHGMIYVFKHKINRDLIFDYVTKP